MRSFKHVPCDTYDGFDHVRCIRENDNFTNIGPVSAVPQPSSAMCVQRPSHSFAVSEILGTSSKKKRNFERREINPSSPAACGPLKDKWSGSSVLNTINIGVVEAAAAAVVHKVANKNENRINNLLQVQARRLREKPSWNHPEK